MPALSSHEGGGAFLGGLFGQVSSIGGKKYLFGDGSYSQNIVQGGSVLQPQASYQPPDYQTTTTPTGVTSTGGVTVIDRSTALFPGMAVSHLGAYDGSSKPLSLFIARRNSTGSYTFVKRLDVTTATQTAGMQWFALPAPYTIPNDGYSYHVGMYYAANTYYKSGTLRAYVSGNFAEGATGSLAEDTSNAMVCGVRYAPIPDCIVITGAATVAPDAGTGAAVYTAKNIVVGSGGSLAPSTNCKGLIGIVSESARLLGGGVMHIDKLGKAGNFGNLTVLDLVPATLKRKLKSSLATFVVLGEGAAGAAGRTLYSGIIPGTAGSAAVSMQTGGGGGGGGNLGVGTHYIGAGGKGGPCCGGAGSGGMYSAADTVGADAGAYGGPGGNAAKQDTLTYSPGGGAGDPVGAGTDGTGTYSGTGAGGGLLMLFTPSLVIASGCTVSADGAAGGAGQAAGSYSAGGGGSAGGGCVVIVTLAGGYSNAGTVRANGGFATSLGGNSGGAGGAGSTNIKFIS